MLLNGSHDEEARRFEELRVTSTWLFFALLSGLVLVALRFFVPYIASNDRVVTGNSLVGLLWSLAWFAVGFLFGFLFGIPKALQGPAPAQAPAGGNTAADRMDASGANAATYRMRVNTNLEEISDWLTKILVGATLTQLGKIPGLILSAASSMAPSMGGAALQSTAAAIILYFVTLGFFTGYVLTRMFFSGAFVRSDRGLAIPSDKEAEALAKAAVTSESPAAPDRATVKAAERMSHVPITDKLTATQALAVARGAIVTDDADRAVEAAALAASKAPSDPQAQLSYGYALFKKKAPTSAVLSQLERARNAAVAAPASIKEEVYNSLVYIALYQDQPAGFSKAIEWGKELLDSSTHPRKRSIWINLACAYGQLYAYTKIHEPKNHAKLREAQDEVSRIVKKCAGDRAAKERLRDLADPEDADGDLATIVADTPELAALLEP